MKNIAFFLLVLSLFSIPFLTAHAENKVNLTSPVIGVSPTPVPTTSAKVIAANVNRTFLLCQNFGAATIVIKLGSAITSQYDGIQLGTNQGILFDAAVPIQAVYWDALSSTGTATCTEGN